MVHTLFFLGNIGNIGHSNGQASEYEGQVRVRYEGDQLQDFSETMTVGKLWMTFVKCDPFISSCAGVDDF